MAVMCPCSSRVNLGRRMELRSPGFPITRKRKDLRSFRVSCTLSSQQDATSRAQNQQIHKEAEEERIMCEACKGSGWLICDFCEGQKTNIQTKNNRIYRRCPTCKTVGYVLCPKCKVFKCVTFPDFFDEVSEV